MKALFEEAQQEVLQEYDFEYWEKPISVTLSGFPDNQKLDGTNKVNDFINE